jgi:uncharacterized membrane protein YedE/YeeE
MSNLLTEPWAPWASGIVIGLMVPGLYLFAGRRFGMSSSLRHIGKMVLPRAKIPYLATHRWQPNAWNLLLVGGVMLGAFMADRTADPALPLLPAEAYTPEGLARLLVGGALVGFGARYAGGCTSGHTISGIANLNWPSMLASAAFFAGGLIAVHGLGFLLLA